MSEPRLWAALPHHYFIKGKVLVNRLVPLAKADRLFSCTAEQLQTG